MTDHAPQMSLEEWLRAAWAGQDAGCPPPEAYLEAETGALTPEQRRRLDDHAERCPACAAERDLARAFDAGAEETGVRREDVAFVVARLEAASPVRASEARGKVVPFPVAPVPRRPERNPVWRLAAAAALVLAAGLAFQLSRPVAPPLPPPSPGGVVRGGEIEAVSPVGEVAEVPAELRWEPRAGAASYRVRLSAVDDTVLWEDVLTGPPARLPVEVTGRLHRAVVYTWTVEALDPSGARLATSEPVRFRARPAP